MVRLLFTLFFIHAPLYALESDIGCFRYDPVGSGNVTVNSPLAKNMRFDQEGMVLIDVDGYGESYHWTWVTRLGLSALRDYCLDESSDSLERARKFAATLLENKQKISDQAIVWRFHFPSNFVPAGWASGMPNSFAANFLVRL